MKKMLKLMAGLLILSGAAYLSSCGDDDTDIGGGGSVPVADGFYVAKVGVNPVASAQLVDEVVEADGFASQDREGFLGSYIYLTAGNYNIVRVQDQEIADTFGGPSTSAGTTGSDCELHAYTLVDEYVVDGAAIAIASEGLYKVTMDNELKEIIFHKIEKAQLIGAATPAGWSNSVDQEMLIEGTPSADGVTFAVEDITMRPGQYKVRFNCRWSIDRRIDSGAGFAFENGYVTFTNFGGTLTNPEPGGSNFEIEVGEDGIYTVEAEFTSTDGFEIVVTKTESIDPIVFDPDDYAWGIIGQGSPQGNWDADIDMTYQGVGANGHSWTGTFALNTSGGFKFRTNDSWTFAPNANAYAAVTGDGASDINATGNDFMASVAGTHLITISTNDAGVTWAIDFDKQ
jgi:hypothetical protein